jgi:hypothetical protein
MTGPPDGGRVCFDATVDVPPPAERAAAEVALGHPVSHLLPAADGLPTVAASVAGDPPRARVAWVRADGAVVVRVACPPGRPSRWRPVVAAVVEIATPGLEDRVLVARAAPEASSVRPVLASEAPGAAVPVAGNGLALARLPAGVAVLGVDALDASGEPIGRLDRPGLSELRSEGAGVSGRLGSTHGMGAGIGGGRWAPGLAEAAFEAGYAMRLPEWTPPGMERGRPRVEPDVSYPAAPPALVIAWNGADGSRVLLRQAPAPLASPDGGGRDATEVDVGGVTGVLRGRMLVTLVWETPTRAFGLQVRGMEDARGVALRVARSIPPADPGPATAGAGPLL